MRVLQVHNRYRVRGGEDTAFDALVALLRARGEEVLTFERDSAAIARGLSGRGRAFLSSIRSVSAARELRALIEVWQPDVVHLHNLYPLISPSVLRPCREAGVPVVMTCHNYRLICPVGTLFSRGAVCERCAGGREVLCAVRNCAGDPLLSTAYALRAMAARVPVNVFHRAVDLFITPSEFVRRKLMEHGYRRCRFAVVPHPVVAPETAADPARGRYVAYLGRISAEKGVGVLLAAARRCPDVPIRIAGDAALMPGLDRAAPPNATFVGPIPRAAVGDFLRGARLLVAPSICYETFGMAVVEAMAHGLPVVASRIGGLPETVQDGATGLLCPPGDPSALADALRTLWAAPSRCRELGRCARDEAGRRFHPGRVFAALVGLYAALRHPSHPGKPSRRA